MRVTQGLCSMDGIPSDPRLATLVLGSRQALATLQGDDIRAARSSGFFPLTPALSLGERVNSTHRRVPSRHFGSPLHDARCSLSLRERVRVRGNGARPPSCVSEQTRNCRTRRVLRQSRRFDFMTMIEAAGLLATQEMVDALPPKLMLDCPLREIVQKSISMRVWKMFKLPSGTRSVTRPKP